MASRRASRAKRERRSASAVKWDGQDLDRHVTPELAVAGAIHLAHPARAERGEDRVRSELTTNHLNVIWLFGRVACGKRRWFFEEPRRTALVAKERLHLLPQRHISAARLL